MKQSNSKTMSQEDKANLYMIMGLMLVVVTSLWIMISYIPKVVFVIAVVIGVLPIIKIIRTDFKDASENEDIIWNKAMHSTLKWVLGLLTYFWLAACLNRIMDLGLCTDVCYMIPILVGIVYVLEGHFFQLYKLMEDNPEE